MSRYGVPERLLYLCFTFNYGNFKHTTRESFIMNSYVLNAKFLPVTDISLILFYPFHAPFLYLLFEYFPTSQSRKVHHFICKTRCR